MNGTKIKNYFAVVFPSASGVVFYTLLTSLMMLLHQFGSIRHYLQIPSDVDFLRMFTGWLDRTITGRFGENVTATLVVGIFWALVGLGVYLLLKAMAKSLAEFSDGLDERRYLWPKGTSRNHALMEAVERTGLRLFAFLGLVFMIFGPLTGLLGGPSGGAITPLQWLVWAVFFWLSLHVVVVLLRLITLKPRLFG